jgi:hypothetical protein
LPYCFSYTAVAVMTFITSVAEQSKLILYGVAAIFNVQQRLVTGTTTMDPGDPVYPFEPWGPICRLKANSGRRRKNGLEFPE